MFPATPNLQGFVCSIQYSGYCRHPPSDGDPILASSRRVSDPTAMRFVLVWPRLFAE
jgi:hypothetical protein